MKRLIIPFIEILLLIASFVFLGLWINDPNGPYEPYFSCCGFGFLIVDLYRRYKPKSSIVDKEKNCFMIDFNYQTFFVARLTIDGNSKSGNMCLGFYDMSIVNNSEQPRTIKDISLTYTLNGNECKESSFVVITGELLSKKNNEKRNLLEIHGVDRGVILMGWDNIRSAIGNREVLKKGGVLSGSAVFFLEAKNIDEVEKISNLQLIIEDYTGANAAQELTLNKKTLGMDTILRIEPKNFVETKET